MPTSEFTDEDDSSIHIRGGTYVRGNVDTHGGDFVARDVVNIYQAPTVQIPQPPAPSLPHDTTRLVGRTTEVSEYTERLQKDGMVLIRGMAGIGKTSLALLLAQHYPRQEFVFWHTLLEHQESNTLAWRLAGFLAWHGKPTVWQMLYSGGQLPPTEVLFDYLIQELAGQTYLVCIDDLQFIEEHPAAIHFVKQLCILATQGQLRLVLTARSTLKFLQATLTTSLVGLGLPDTQKLLSLFQLALSPELVAELHRRTEGNVQFLILAIDTLRHSNNPARIIEHLAKVDNVEGYLLDRIDSGLSDEERATMETLAVLLGNPVPRSTIELLFGGGNLRRTLHKLGERHLIVTSKSEGEILYSQHAIVRDFYYADLDLSRKHLLHQRTAVHYSNSSEFVMAALHWHKAGDDSAAANTLYEHCNTILNGGNAHALYDVQAQLNKTHLDDIAWAKVKVVAGRAATFVADTTSALTEFAEVVMSSDAYLRAQAHYYSTQLMIRVDHDGARRHADCGIAILEPGISDDRFAALLSGFYLLLAFFYLEEIHDPKQAEDYLAKARVLVVETDFSRQFDIHKALSILCSERGDTQGELAHLEQAQQAAIKTQKNDLMIIATQNLGQFYVWADEHTVGLEYLQQAKTLAIAIGHRGWIATCDNTIAASYFFQGHYLQSIEHNQAAYLSFQQIGDQNMLAGVCHDLAEVYGKTGDFTLALKYFREAITINKHLELQSISEALTNLAQQYPILLNPIL